MPRDRTHRGKDDQISDRVRFLHMRDAALDARSYIAGQPRAALDTNSMLLRALVQCLEVIGKAAAKTSDSSRLRAPSVPWPKLVGMRHILVHVYYDIDADTVWRVVTEDLDRLLEALDAALASWPDAAAS